MMMIGDEEEEVVNDVKVEQYIWWQFGRKQGDYCCCEMLIRVRIGILIVNLKLESWISFLFWENWENVVKC